MALAKEKKSLTNELLSLVKDIKKSKHKIKKHFGNEGLKINHSSAKNGNNNNYAGAGRDSLSSNESSPRLGNKRSASAFSNFMSSNNQYSQAPMIDHQ